jgi:hypothetical protein
MDLPFAGLISYQDERDSGMDSSQGGAAGWTPMGASGGAGRARRRGGEEPRPGRAGHGMAWQGSWVDSGRTERGSRKCEEAWSTRRRLPRLALVGINAWWATWQRVRDREHSSKWLEVRGRSLQADGRGWKVVGGRLEVGSPRLEHLASSLEVGAWRLELGGWGFWVGGKAGSGLRLCPPIIGRPIATSGCPPDSLPHPSKKIGRKWPATQTGGQISGPNQWGTPSNRNEGTPGPTPLPNAAHRVYAQKCPLMATRLIVKCVQMDTLITTPLPIFSSS